MPSHTFRVGSNSLLCEMPNVDFPDDPFVSALFRSHLATNEIVRQCRQAVEIVVGPALFYSDVLTFDQPKLAKSPAQCGNEMCERSGWRGTKEPDHRHGGLLRVRGQRPHRRVPSKPMNFRRPRCGIGEPAYFLTTLRENPEKGLILLLVVAMRRDRARAW